MCPFGKYWDSSYECVACDHGKYRGDASSLECQNCGMNKYTPDAINCNDCPTNTVSNNDANTECKPECNAARR